MPLSDYLLEIKPAGTWIPIADGDVLSVRGSWSVSSNENSGVAFGDDTDASISGELTLNNWSNINHFTPIRYTTTMDADTTKTFTGVITRHARDMSKISLDATGMKALVAATKVYSPSFARRPVATKTTSSSIENPATAGYVAGHINYLLFTAGGWPYEQAGSNPTATFYYSCDHAVLAPDWTWAAGEDAWAECLQLAKDSGGQMYQDANGVVRYRQIVGYGGQTTSDTLTEGDYAEIEQVIDPGLIFATKITCQYVPRRRLGLQEIADDTTPHHIEPGETATIVIEQQNPIAFNADGTHSLEAATPGGSQLKPAALVVAQQDGTTIQQGAGGYAHTLDVKAARVTITVTNNSSKACTVWRVRLNACPIVVGEAGSVSADSGATPVVERILEQSPYIQNASAAQRIADMTLAFYGAARPMVTARGCVHIPSRAIGNALLLTCTPWSMSAQKHVVLSKSHDDTGVKDDLVLAYVEDLPATSAFFIVGHTYVASDNRLLGW